MQFLVTWFSLLTLCVFGKSLFNIVKLPTPELSVIDLPISYYRGNAASVDISDIDYYAIFACNDYSDQYPKFQLSILLSDNVYFMTTKGFVYVELSTNQYKWTSPNVFASNYLSSGSNVYNNITWSYGNDTTFYMRVAPRVSSTTYSFNLEYVMENVSDQLGSYDELIFNTPTVSTSTPFSEVSQYLKTSEIQSVQTSSINYYSIRYCIDNFGTFNSKYSISVLAAVDYAVAPLSAFDLYACPSSWGSQCTNINSVWRSENATGVVLLQMTNGTKHSNQRQTLDDGIILLVLGIGAEKDNNNVFTLTSLLNTDES